MSVILSTKVGVCMMLLPVLLPGPMSLLGGLCLWSHVLSRVVSVQGGSLSRGLCPGGLSPGGSLSRGVSIREIPPYGEEWVVRILLECVLVIYVIVLSIYDDSWCFKVKFFFKIFLLLK